MRSAIFFAKAAEKMMVPLAGLEPALLAEPHFEWDEASVWH